MHFLSPKLSLSFFNCSCSPVNVNPYHVVCNYSAFTCFPWNWYIIFLCLTLYCACYCTQYQNLSPFYHIQSQPTATFVLPKTTHPITATDNNSYRILFFSTTSHCQLQLNVYASKIDCVFYHILPPSHYSQYKNRTNLSCLTNERIYHV